MRWICEMIAPCPAVPGTCVAINGDPTSGTCSLRSTCCRDAPGVFTFEILLLVMFSATENDWSDVAIMSRPKNVLCGKKLMLCYSRERCWWEAARIRAVYRYRYLRGCALSVERR